MNTVTQTMHFRQALIKYSQKYGVTKAAIRYKTNRQYIYRWLKRYDGTIQSLADKSHRPHHHPNQHTESELKLFEALLKHYGIKHKLIRPYTPRHNGKVERSHRKDNEYFYATHKFFSFDDFKKQLSVRNREYNNFPMRPLNWKSPADSIRACPSFNVARVGTDDRPFSRGLYPATERVMEPAAFRGGGHLALVIFTLFFPTVRSSDFVTHH